MVEEKGTLQRGLRTLWIMWAGMFGSLFIYIFICHQLGVGKMSPMGSDFPIKTVKNALYLVVMAELAVSYLLRKHLLKAQSPQSRLRHLQMTSHRATHPAVALYTTAVILSLAIAESIGIYGLLLFLLGEDFRTLYMFIAVSALALFYYRPKREELEDLVNAYAEAKESILDM